MEISQGNSLCSYLYVNQAKNVMFFFLSFIFYKIGGPEGKQVLPRQGFWAQWEGQVIGKGG
jgi:hypothetical protein